MLNSRSRTNPGIAAGLLWAAPIGLLLGTALASSSSWQNKDASQWTDEEARQILTNSPWSKSAKLTEPRQPNSGEYGSDPSQSAGSPGGTWGNGGQMPGGMGGAGRGGMGGGGMGGGGNRGGGMGPGGGSRFPTEQSEVTIQWQSALPVRLALAKKSGGSAESSPLQPLDEYVIAVEGIPAQMPNMRRSSGTADSDGTGQTDQADQTETLQARLKQSASLIRKGHDPINPVKVEVSQGSGGETAILHFPKTDPITLGDKDVELRITAGRMEVDRKFNLKDMQYHGKLEL